MERYRKLSPDVVLMDLVMPVCDGVEATKRIVALDAAARIVAITSVDDHRALALRLAAGARGCLKKGPDTISLAQVLLALAAKPPAQRRPGRPESGATGPQLRVGQSDRTSWEPLDPISLGFAADHCC